MLTKEKLFSQLDAFAIPDHTVVMAHTSLHAVGPIEGRAEGLIAMLEEYFTAKNSLFCIPTHTWDRCGGDVIALDMTQPYTCIGTLPTVAARIAKHRTENPSHSMAVFGPEPDAAAFAALDDNIASCTSPDSCHGEIYKRDGWILLIGVGHNKNTFLHCVDEMLQVPNRMTDEPVALQVKRKDGTVVTKRGREIFAKGIPDVSAYFPKLEPAFRYYGAIRDGFIGDAPTMLCSTAKMVQVCKLVYGRSAGTELFADAKPLAEELYK